MRYLGIDYGHKKIGLALSDEEGNFVYPYLVVNNDQKVQNLILDLCSKEQVGEIVIGASLNFKGEPNPIFKQSELFADQLKNKLNLPVNFHNETYSSREAARVIGADKNLDARAAAIILDSYLSSRRPK